MATKLRSVQDHLKEKLKDRRLRVLYELGGRKPRLPPSSSGQHISKIEEGDFSSLATIQKVLLALGYHVALRAIPLEPQVRRALQRAA